MEDGTKEEVKKNESDDEDEDEPTKSRKDGEEVQVRDVQYKLENLDFPNCKFAAFILDSNGHTSSLYPT